VTSVTLKPLIPPAILSEASFKRRYSSDTDDLIHDFFVPALSRAIRYDRAVGYFTAGALARLAPAIDAYLDRGNTSNPIRVMASPHLPASDIRQMTLGYEQRTIEQECTERRPEFEDALSSITWMIQKKMMEFWLIPGYADGTKCLYHEKIGVIEDSVGNYLTFEGSPNETFSGLGSNIESFPVHRSWIDAEAPHAAAAKASVDALFDQANPRGLQIVPFPQALQQGLVSTYTPRPPRPARRSAKMAPPKTAQTDATVALPEAPEGLDLRSYQSDAIRAWLQTNGRGLLEMATGTGKTVTALGAIERIARTYEQSPGLTVVVVVPDKSLVSMWEQELQLWGITPVCSTHPSCREVLRKALVRQRVKGGTSIAVWTAASARNRRFQTLIGDYPSPRLLVADECHALGSDLNRKLLTDQFHYRLGLSATVERHLDPDGTSLLRSYFGEMLLKIGIREAIELGALCHYEYIPVLVPLNDDEMQEYSSLTTRIGRLVASSSSLSIRDLEESAKMLLLERARLLWHAERKVAAFRDVLNSLPQEQRSHSLVYTAEGESPLSGTRQGPQIHQEARDLGLRYEDFVGDTPIEEREILLSQLRSGEVHGLVAMKCLDQGIDIPSARAAHFLSSTRNPRQYVQRRGRILRRDPNNPEKLAIVFDYIAHPREVGQNFELERKLVAQEILRAHEMADAADNRQQAVAQLQPILNGYNLWDTLGQQLT